VYGVMEGREGGRGGLENQYTGRRDRVVCGGARF